VEGRMRGMWWLIGVGGLLAVAVVGVFIQRAAMRDPNITNGLRGGGKGTRFDGGGHGPRDS
jgi:hypothetical protein